MSNQVEVEIIARLDKLDASLNDAKKAAQAAGDNIAAKLGDELSNKIGGAYAKIAAYAAAAGSAILAAFSLDKAIEAASQQEIAINRLNLAMAAAGTYSASASQKIQDFATQIQRTTTISDESATSYVALARNLTRTNEQAVGLTKAAIDLAAATGRDVPSALEALGRSLQGSAGGLSRIVPGIKNFTEEQLKAGAAIDFVAARFNGTAAGQINTYAGAVMQAKNAFGELLESIGNLVIKSPVVIEVVKFIGQQFLQLADNLTKFSAGKDIIGDLIKVTIQWGQALNMYVIAPLELAYNVVKVVFDGIKTAIQSAIADLAGRVSLVTGLLAKLAPDTFSGINDAAKLMADSTQEVLNDFAGDAKAAYNDIFDFSFTASSDKFLTKLADVANNAKIIHQDIANGSRTAAIDINNNLSLMAYAYQTLVGKTKPNLAQLEASAKKTFTEIKESAFNQVVTGLGNAFAAMGASLINGGNVFAAFGKVLLGVFGDIAIQLGTGYILLGIARLIAFDPTGAAQIAAGGALATFGGVLKALAGSGGGGAPSTSAPSADTGGGVGAGIDPSTGNPSTQSTAVQKQEPQSQIAVNIEGNVLGDKRTLGRDIADAINEAFGSDGVKIASGAVS